MSLVFSNMNDNDCDEVKFIGVCEGETFADFVLADLSYLYPQPEHAYAFCFYADRSDIESLPNQITLNNYISDASTAIMVDIYHESFEEKNHIFTAVYFFTDRPN